MTKKRILVQDKKGVFLKMFKRKLKNEYDFFEKVLSIHDENNDAAFDRTIFVIYEKIELIEFLKLGKKGADTLVCLFNKQLFQSLVFFEDLNDVVFVDGMKTRNEIFKDLKNNFKDESVLITKFPEIKIQNSLTTHIKMTDFYKALYFLV